MRIRSFVAGVVTALAVAGSAWAEPKVVVISLDGARPDFIQQYLDTGVLDRGTGLGRLVRHGVRAERNVTANPSLTAPGHILMATGSTSAHNDIASNTFHPVAGTAGASFSGFAAPIGGYEISPLGPTPEAELTAIPLWVNARREGKIVVAATWAGADGADIGLTVAPNPSVVIQPVVPYRTVDYTVPFGAFGGVGAQGYPLTAASFAAADPSVVSQLAAAGFTSLSPVQQASLETVFCAPTAATTCGTTSSSVRTLRYVLVAAALDTTADGKTNYDTLVVFTVAGPATPGITDAPSVLHTGPFAAPSTGPAVVRLGQANAPFFFEGSGSVVGAAFFVTRFESDLSTVNLIRYSANFIPRNAAALDAVNDINNNVGFWRPQPDFRIPERLSPGFDKFPDTELEAAWEDLVATWIPYQTSVALHALRANPDADLAMIYFEQPDGSEHQFLLTDWRQPTNPRDPTSIGSPGFPAGATGQDPAKVARYRTYVQNAYRAADAAVEKVIQATGVTKKGAPKSNVIVVSDHGFAPFYTSVNVTELLKRAGVDTTKVIVRTSGPAANVYVNLAGREAGGTVSPDDYGPLVAQIAAALGQAVDPNAMYNGQKNPTFTQVVARPDKCKKPGFCTSKVIGQDYGDVFATMAEGYNFDGIQTPVVARLGDPAIPAGTTPVYSLPNFYGAHGHDPKLRNMSATFIAAGPDFREGVEIEKIHNIDIAPTVLELLDVEPANTVDGRVIRKALEQPRHCDWKHWWRCWDDQDDDDHGHH